MSQSYLPTIAEVLFRIRQALSEKLPPGARSDLRGADYELSGILLAAGFEPGTTALEADAVKLQAMGQPRPPYAAPPLLAQNAQLKARVEELEARLNGSASRRRR